MSSIPPDSGSAGLAERMLAALLAAAEKRQVTALVGASDPPIGVVVLPELGAGVVIVDRGTDAPASLKERLDAILHNQASGVLHLLLAGGTDADRAVLAAADREAPDPNRLGVHLLGQSGQVARVAGRRLGLLAEAARLLGEVKPLDHSQLIGHNTEAQRRREEAATFAAALDRRPQRAIRLLGVIAIVMFALETLWGQRSFQLVLIQMGANHGELVAAQGEVWRLLSHAFLHGFATHLIVNLIGLFSFGSFLEGLLGWRRIVLLYGLSALGGGLASAFIGEAVLSVGASGAIWGLMTAGLGIVVRRQSIMPPLIGARLRPRLFAVLALNIFFSLMPRLVPGFPNIDLWAHLGGGAVGFALAASGLLTLGLGPGAAPSDPAVNPRWLRVAALVMIAVMAASVAAALLTGKPWRPQATFEPDQLTRVL